MGRTKATTGPDRAAQTTAGKAWAKACAAAVDAATLMAGLSGTAASLPAARAQTAFGSMAALRAAAEAQGSGDFSPLWAGQNVASCRPMPAAELTRELARGFKAHRG